MPSANLQTLTVYTAHRDYAGADRVAIEPHDDAPFRLLAPGVVLVPAMARAAHLGATAAAWGAMRAQYEKQVRGTRKAGFARDAWRALLGREVVTLVCRCSDAERCHRRWLAALLAEAGAVDGGERAL